ncbi:MAG: class I tRNA ligase family protein [bacterium]|nr:class I tRNA ligase family protein [bacterium]
MFQKPDPKQSFPKLEEQILEYWKTNKTFEKSLEKNKGNEEYVFYDGPPFATGLPHYGHILAGTLKDVIPRYHTMRGRYVPRRWGWDCHGLPVEALVEKELGLKSKREIEEFGIDKFNEACRSSVLRYVSEWKKTVNRMGRWVDFEDSYKTMDPSFMESVWWAFRQLWDKKLIYKGQKNMLICARCVTPLSNFEASLNYKDVDDHAIAVKMFLKEKSAQQAFPNISKPIALIPWTTTPWTLPANMAMYVGGDISYVLIEEEQECYILAEATVPKFYKKEEPANIVETFPGKKLVGLEYQPLFPYHPEGDYKKDHPNVYTILKEDIVDASEGTGVVHSAVTYGDEGDFEIATRNNLPFIHHVNMDGSFADYVTEFAGKNWKQAEDEVAAALKKRNLVVKYETYRHSYPHCWRCDSPLMYNTLPAWFVNIDQVKEKMLASNQKVNWVPEHLKNGRFGKWLENARDWCISRNRFWGCPLPVWEGEKGTQECLGSLADLRARVSGRFTKLTLLRHGESEGNTIGLRQSRPPGTGLTDQGKDQSEEAGKLLKEIHKNEHFDLILHSPLLRAEQTAAIVGKHLKGVPVHMEADLKEVDLGDLEGKREVEVKDFLAHRHGLTAQEHYKEPYAKTGESHQRVTERMLELVKKLCREHAGKSILLVSHSDPIRLLLRELEGKSLEWVYEKGHLPMGVPKTLYIDNESGRPADLHKHFVDELSYIHPKTGETMKRIPEVLDCWFESGSMPYAQAHYPFENKEEFERTFPANYIAEGLDQTRGWFYTLIVLSAALFEQPAFQNVVVNGIVLAEDGQKMSKSKKNYPDPQLMFDNFGADAMRVYLMHSPVVKADDLRFSEKGVQDVVRQSFLPLWNAYSFLLTYAEIDGWKPRGQFYFVRHGETDVNKERKLQGSMDEPLNDRGRDQIQELRQVVKNLHIDVIACSSHIRAKETADILNADLGVELEVFDDLREQSFGSWEGKPFRELEKKCPEGMHPFHFMRQKPPKGETIGQFEQRCLKTLKEVQRKHAGKNVLVVGHGGTFHVLRKWHFLAESWDDYYKHHYKLARHGQLELFERSQMELANKLDRWILSELHALIGGMTNGLENYELAKGLDPLVRFIDSLTNWYIRRSRRRFWKSESDTDKEEAYQTLYLVLVQICRLLAPFAPFISEDMYRNLTGFESVHLSDWPDVEEYRIDAQLNAEIEVLRQIVTLGHAARAQAKVKVRQPLSKVEVALPASFTGDLGEHLEVLKEELNVKEIELLASVDGKVKVVVKPNGRLLGPKLGAAVQDVIREAKAGNFKRLENGNYQVLGHELTPEEIEVVYQALDEGDKHLEVQADQGLVVILHTDVTPELQREGYARDLVRGIQDLRKQADLNVADRIRVGISTEAKDVQRAVDEFENYIQKETLAVAVQAEKLTTEWESVLNLGEHGVVVTVEKV